MKKLFTLFLAALTAFSLAACGGGSRGADPTAEPAHNETNVPIKNTPAAEEPTEAPKPSEKLTLEALLAHEPSPAEDFHFSGESGIILKYVGSDNAVVIPETIDSCSVFIINRFAFSNNDFIEGILFPDSMTEIDEDACIHAKALKYAVMGESLKVIGCGAFLGCISLEKVVLNEGIEKIGASAFFGCEKLKEIYIPETVTNIDLGAFLGCADGFRIIGKSGSYAETYAKENNIEFIAK